MKRIFTVLGVVCTAIVVGCASSQVSPGVVSDTSGSKACCSSHSDASPGAVGGCADKADCASKCSGEKSEAVSPGAVSGCADKASAKQCPVSGATVSPGAVSESKKSCGDK